MEIWRKVHKLIKAKPIVAGRIDSAVPLYAERYLLGGADRIVQGFDMIGLLTQFGGAQVRGEAGHWRAVSLPSQSLLVPRNCATRWHYSGTVDFAVFYLTDEAPEIVERLLLLTRGQNDPLLFSDPLVCAAALEIMKELAKGADADQPFVESLVDVMLEQTYRALTTKTGRHSPRNIHLARLQKVLPYIREHLAEDLRAQTLAGMADVSIVHFRRLFQEALGMPLHRYILNARLELAQKLLGTTDVAILRIAEECGFSSQSHLTASFKATHAVTPAEYRASVRYERHRRSD